MSVVPVAMTADPAPGNTATKTTRSRSRKCCRLGMTAAGNIAVALLTLVLYLAPRCQGMPVATSGGISQHWWHTPCGLVGEMVTRRPAETTGQMKSFRKTKTQVQLAHEHYRSLPLKNMYAEVVGALEEAYEYHWLPDKQLEWFREEFGKANGNIHEMAPKVLYQLHKDLQKFAVTLDKLYRHVHEEEHSPFGRRRSKTLLDLCLELKRLLCEVEESLSTAGKEPPSPPANSTLIPADKWDTRRDKTAVLIQDWGVLESYGKFLEDWRAIVDKLLESASGAKRRRLNQKGKHKGGKKKRPGAGNKRRRNGSSSSQEDVRTPAVVASSVEDGAEERQQRAPSEEVRRRGPKRGNGKRKNRVRGRDTPRVEGVAGAVVRGERT